MTAPRRISSGRQTCWLSLQDRCQRRGSERSQENAKTRRGEDAKSERSALRIATGVAGHAALLVDEGSNAAARTEVGGHARGLGPPVAAAGGTFGAGIMPIAVGTDAVLLFQGLRHGIRQG